MNGYPLQQTTAFLDLRGVCRNRPKRLTEDFSFDLPSNFSRSNLYGESRETCVSRAKKSFWVENDDFWNFLKFRFPIFLVLLHEIVLRGHIYAFFNAISVKRLMLAFIWDHLSAIWSRLEHTRITLPRPVWVKWFWRLCTDPTSRLGSDLDPTCEFRHQIFFGSTKYIARPIATLISTFYFSLFHRFSTLSKSAS